MGIGKLIRPGFTGLLLLFFTSMTMSSPLSPKKQKIYVTSNGWHTGIVINRKFVSPMNMPEIVDMSQAEFVEFGWGDANFYPAKKHTVDMTLEAALIPTKAVMHVVGLPAIPSRYFARAEALPLSLNKVKHDQLVAFISNSFDRKGALRANPITSGLYKSSNFYPANGKFHLMNNCNNWTAQALRASGFKIKLIGIIQAEPLMRQIRTLSRQQLLQSLVS